MNSFETKKEKTTREELAEAEKQKTVFKVNDKRSGKKYEVVMDASGKKQVLNREKKVAELENKIRETEKQEISAGKEEKKAEDVNWD